MRSRDGSGRLAMAMMQVPVVVARAAGGQMVDPIWTASATSSYTAAEVPAPLPLLQGLHSREFY